MSEARHKKPDGVTEEQEAINLLAEAACSGDQKAFGLLIEKTQARLFRFTLALCGNRQLAEDLCQEAYLKAFSRLSTLENGKAFLDWLFQITKNQYLDHVRSKASRTVSTEDEPIADESTSSADFAEALAVHEALSQFEPEDRWLLLLVDLEERTYREAAEQLSITEDAVRTRLFRLRKEFLQKWKKD